MTLNLVRPRNPDRPLEAAGYVRVSHVSQADGYSPETQRAAIRALAAQQGYTVTMIEEDHESGTHVSRLGYQRVIDAVRAGLVQAVIVMFFDRFGREGAEWLARAHEFERLGVPIISVQEGPDQPGILRFVRAGMAEQFSRDLARKVRPGREASARAGNHLGPTPYGYRREYPPYQGAGKHHNGRLVPDEATAWVVREIFERYAAGGWSHRRLLEWLRTDPRVPPRTGDKSWSVMQIRSMLHRITYAGAVRYNETARGLYERARPGSMFVVENAHEAIISMETWQTVQRLMAQARTMPSRGRIDPKTALATGFLRCGACGGPMYSHRYHSVKEPRYTCLKRSTQKDCTDRPVRESLVDAALLAEISRLQGAPWTAAVESRLTRGQSPSAGRRAGIERALAAAQEELRTHTLAGRLLGETPEPEQVADWRAVSAEISGRIRALRAQLATQEEPALELGALRAVHASVTRTEIAVLIERSRAEGLTGDLRLLLAKLIDTARVTQRVPDTFRKHMRWVRVEVTWTPQVRGLLSIHALTLAPPPEPPVFPSEREQRNVRDRARRAVQRADVEAYAPIRARHQELDRARNRRLREARLQAREAARQAASEDASPNGPG